MSSPQTPSPDINSLITAGRAEFIAGQSNTYDLIIKPYLLIIQKLAEESALIAKENESLKKTPKNRAQRRKAKKKPKKN